MKVGKPKGCPSEGIFSPVSKKALVIVEEDNTIMEESIEKQDQKNKSSLQVSFSEEKKQRNPL